MQVRGFHDRTRRRARKVKVEGNRWVAFAEDQSAPDDLMNQTIADLADFGITIDLEKAPDLPVELLARLLDQLKAGGIRPGAGGTGGQFSERKMSNERRRQLLSCTPRGKQLLAKEDKVNREHRQFAETLRDELTKRGIRL